MGGVKKIQVARDKHSLQVEIQSTPKLLAPVKVMDNNGYIK